MDWKIEKTSCGSETADAPYICGASEGSTCNGCVGTVWYGRRYTTGTPGTGTTTNLNQLKNYGHYTKSSAGGSMYCSNGHFGDPLHGVYKHCFCEPYATMSSGAGLKCPGGYTQRGGLGADKGGCGLEGCGARYGAQAKNTNKCAEHCNGRHNCKSFSYAPMNGDKNHQGKKVCTIYSSTDFNQRWYGRENGKLKYMQIACIKN